MDGFEGTSPAPPLLGAMVQAKTYLPYQLLHPIDPLTPSLGLTAPVALTQLTASTMAQAYLTQILF